MKIVHIIFTGGSHITSRFARDKSDAFSRTDNVLPHDGEHGIILNFRILVFPKFQLIAILTLRLFIFSFLRRFEHLMSLMLVILMFRHYNSQLRLRAKLKQTLHRNIGKHNAGFAQRTIWQLSDSNFVPSRGLHKHYAFFGSPNEFSHL